MALFWWRASWDTSMHELEKKKATLDWKLRHVSFNHRWDQMRGSFSFKTFHQYLSMVLAFIHSFAQYLSMILQHSLIHSLSKHLRSTYLHPALSQALETRGWTKQALILWCSCFSEESDDREDNSEDTGKCLHQARQNKWEYLIWRRGSREAFLGSWHSTVMLRSGLWEAFSKEPRPELDGLPPVEEVAGRQRKEEERGREVFATQWECWRDLRREGRSSVIRHTDRIEASREVDQVRYY